MEIGIDSFAEAKQNNGRTYSENSAQSISELLDRIEHADKVGLDVFGIGEQYRREFLDSANSGILSAAASRTKSIRLTSAVTVLSAADPVRAFQNFATLDLVSSGRAEMVVGRGSFTESYPLFELNLNEYDEIIIIGSGKGVTSVNTILKPFWKRKSLTNYRILLKIYQKAVTNCPRYIG